MRISAGHRHIKTSLLFLAVSAFLLVTTLYIRITRSSSDVRARSLMSDTRQVFATLNSKINDVIASGTGGVNRSSNKLPAIPEKGAILIDRRIADEVSKKIRLLCWIPSREMYMDTRLKAVNSTWAKRCDKIIYFMTNPKIIGDDIISVNISDSRKTLTEKTVFAHKYIYRHYLTQYDWFLKADDDTYVVVENLKFLLSHFDPSSPGYIGCQFKHFAPQGYMSGGAGYAFNALGIRKLVENGYEVPGRCRLKGGAEDIETGRCAYKAGIPTLDQLDTQRKQTFFPSNLYATVLGPVPSWVSSYMRAALQAGQGCCSPLVVSFHYMGPKLQYITEFLLYGVVVHGRAERMDVRVFNGSVAKDMGPEIRRRPYPGEKLEEYYQKGWRTKNTTIYINPHA